MSGIAELNFNSGLEQGREQGKFIICADMVDDGTITLQQAAQRLGLTVEKMQKLMEERAVTV